MAVPYFSKGCLFGLCVCVRLILAGFLGATHWLPAWARVAGGSVAAVLSFNFAVATWRMKPTGAFKGCAWWGALRKVHTALWAVVAALLFAEVPYGGWVALIDPAIAIVSYWTVRPAFYQSLAKDDLLCGVRDLVLLDNDER
jgi:hypothetical protein